MIRSEVVEPLDRTLGSPERKDELRRIRDALGDYPVELRRGFDEREVVHLHPGDQAEARGKIGLRRRRRVVWLRVVH